jgi:hypothetical protein
MGYLKKGRDTVSLVAYTLSMSSTLSGCIAEFEASGHPSFHDGVFASEHRLISDGSKILVYKATRRAGTAREGWRSS